MSTDTQTVDTELPPQETHDGQTEIISDGKPVKRSSFSDNLQKEESRRTETAKDEPAEKPAPEAAPNDAPKGDPIAEKIAEAAAQKTDKLKDSPRSKSLLDDALPKKKDEPKPEAKPEAKEEPAVTDKDIEEELANPHISDKRAARMKALHKQWKDADAKVATTAKQLAEKDAKLADLEKKISEAGKAANVPADVQAQLDELVQYRRRYQVEGSERYKEFDTAYTSEESAILNVLKNAGVKFKDSTWEQTEAYIKQAGGFAEFQKKHPAIARQIREDVLEVAEGDEITSSISRQQLLKKAQQAYLDGEQKQAKEYFAKAEAETKAQREAAEKAPKPEAAREQRRASLEKWREETFQGVELFRDEAIPAEASESARKSIKERNEFAAQLRQTLAANLNAESEQDFADVALAATLAHQFNRDNKTLRTQVESLEKELVKLKGAGKTITKTTQTPAGTTPDKTPKTFSDALDRVQRNRE